MTEGKKSRRGFASMTPERRRELASMGGKSVPASKRTFSNKKLASEAGKKGGKAPRRKKVADAPV